MTLQRLIIARPAQLPGNVASLLPAKSLISLNAQCNPRKDLPALAS